MVDMYISKRSILSCMQCVGSNTTTLIHFYSLNPFFRFHSFAAPISEATEGGGRGGGGGGEDGEKGSLYLLKGAVLLL